MLITVVTSLFPVPSWPYRGWPIYKTVEALRKYADVHVVCPSAVYPGSARRSPHSRRLDNGQADLPSTFFDYPSVPVLSRPWNGRVCAKRLYPHLSRLRPDLVLNYWLYPEGYAALQVARALNVPVIVGSRGSDLRLSPDPFTRRFAVHTVRTADHLVTVSEDLRRCALSLGVAAERVTTIPNGAETSVFRFSDRLDARRSLGLSPDESVVLYIGRFYRAKGLMELVQSFALLAAEHPHLRLAFVGSGPLRAEMLRCAEASGIAGRLLLPGDQNRSEVALWLNAVDVLCLPSYSEGCPNVVIEAMACGCPVVASEVGGVPELVNPQCAILVPPRNTVRLADGLRQALSRTWDRMAISASHTRSWDQVGRETYEVCRTVGVRSAASHSSSAGAR